ncbi:MAG TPA: beta-ketoacyl synthase chain length factor [Puia sp.]|jgi:hypothetical protein|nr:beta-ketoacyl synthase chain length factor [Puia sp.]
MFYIHHSSCISPQRTFSTIDMERANGPTENKLLSVEPSYEGIPLNILRRMGKAVRTGVGGALPVIKYTPDGIIIGTANGGMEDCIKFLNQIIEYDEGMLTPTNFVQSTANAIAGQIGLLTLNRGYNCTHVHRGLAFENAILDVDMLLKENPSGKYLLGGVDEISDYNYNIDFLGGWYKKEKVNGADLYDRDSPGTIAGEGATMFLANNVQTHADAQLQAIRIMHTDDAKLIADNLDEFLQQDSEDTGEIDLFLSGESGDNRFQKYYNVCENMLNPNVAVARFKHIFGEYPSVSAAAVWLSSFILKHQTIPKHLLKYPSEKKMYQKILIYNNYKGIQHSFILLSKP